VVCWECQIGIFRISLKKNGSGEQLGMFERAGKPVRSKIFVIERLSKNIALSFLREHIKSLQIH